MSARRHPAATMKDDIVNFKRERIVQAAVDLFYEHGYQNTTLDTVADALGVRKPFVYSYFESKADLLATICERGIGHAVKALEEILDVPADPTTHLQRIGEMMIATVTTYQKHNVIWAREEKNLPPAHFRRLKKLRREFDRKLEIVLQRGCATGEFSIPDPALAALAIGGMGTWVQVWYRADGRLDSVTLGRKLTELILRMVKAESTRPSNAEPHNSQLEPRDAGDAQRLENASPAAHSRPPRGSR
jgi:AcrR family transcriptional regulator